MHNKMNYKMIYMSKHMLIYILFYNLIYISFLILTNMIALLLIIYL